MSLTIAIRDGVPCVELPDSRGHVHAYAVEALPTEAGASVYRVRRLDGEGDDHTHTVHLAARWKRCSCRAWQYRWRRAGKPCKHVECVEELRAFLGAMAR